MKWWKGLFGLQRDGQETKAVVGLNDALAGHYSASRHDGDNFRTNQVTLAQYNDANAATATGALGAATTWACIRLLAGTIGSLPLMVYRRVNGFNVEAPDHPLARLLHDQPNSEQTPIDFWEFMQASLELEGHAYSPIKRRGDRISSLMQPIAPGLMTRRRLVNGDTEYSWVLNGERHTCTSRDMLHIRGFLAGASTLSVCRRVFGTALSIDSAATATFANGIRPSGVLLSKDTFDKDQRKEAEQYLLERYQGTVNSGVPMVLDRDMTWQQLTINPEDAQMLESRAFSVEEICRVFGVPPHMVGHTAGNTQLGSSISEQTRGFEKNTLRQRVKRVEQAVAMQLLSPADLARGISIKFNMEALLRGSPDERAKFHESGLRNGWLTINEVRATEGLPPVPGGDVPRMQMQNVPITYEPDQGGNDGGAAPALPPA